MTKKQIRRAIRKYVEKFGKQDSRYIIEIFSKGIRTSKQRISGNISCLVCIDGTVSLIRNKPHSVMYSEKSPVGSKTLTEFFFVVKNFEKGIDLPIVGRIIIQL